MTTRISVLAAALALSTALLQAGDAPVPEAQPQPARQPQTMHMPPMANRPAPGFEVEAISLRSSAPASVSAWAELAAEGFHVVAAVSQADGTVIVLCERQARSELHGVSSSRGATDASPVQCADAPRVEGTGFGHGPG